MDSDHKMFTILGTLGITAFFFMMLLGVSESKQREEHKHLERMEMIKRGLLPADAGVF